MMKANFLEDLNGLEHKTPRWEKITIGGDLNDYLDREGNGYRDIYGGYGFGKRNIEGKAIFDKWAHHSQLWFKKWNGVKEEHLSNSEEDRNYMSCRHTSPNGKISSYVLNQSKKIEKLMEMFPIKLRQDD